MGARGLAALFAAAQLMLLAFCGNASAAAGCGAAGDARAAVVCEINAMRAANGLAALNANGQLAAAAQAFANDMAARHYFSHVTPDGVTLADRVRPTGYIPAHAVWGLAEDLDWGTNVFATPLAAVAAWMSSAEHRANMLDPQMQDVGVGVAEGAAAPGAERGVFYVADFGCRSRVRATRRRPRAHRARAHRRAHRTRTHRAQLTL